jgi:hypothetical protein
MDQTNWEHVAVALAHQLLIGLIFGNWWAGSLTILPVYSFVKNLDTIQLNVLIVQW